jgi:hypothetical protein
MNVFAVVLVAVMLLLATTGGNASAYTTVPLPQSCGWMSGSDDSADTTTADMIGVAGAGAGAGPSKQYIVDFATKAVAVTLPACSTQCGTGSNHCYNIAIDSDNQLAFYSGGDGFVAYSTAAATAATEKWSLANMSCSWGPYYYDASLYVVSSGGDLVKLDSATGTTLWIISSGSFVGQPIVAQEDTVLIKDSSKGLCAFSTAGKPLWCNNNIFPIVYHSTMSIISNTFLTKSVFLQDTNTNAVHKVSLVNGKEEWSVPNLVAPVPLSNNLGIHNSPMIKANSFEVFAYNGTGIIKMDTTDGTVSVLLQPGVKKNSNGFCIDATGRYLYNIAAGNSIQEIDTVTGGLLEIPVTSGNVMQCIVQDRAIYYLTDAPSVLIAGGEVTNNAAQEKRRGGGGKKAQLKRHAPLGKKN